MLLTANVAEWGIFAHLDTYLLDLDGPFQSLWVRTGGMADPDCPVCGRGPEGETQHDGRQDLNYLLPLPIEAL